MESCFSEASIAAQRVPGRGAGARFFAVVNTLRKEVTIQNNSNGILYVIRGGGVTATNYNWKLKRGDHLTIDDFRGDIKGIFTNATGFAMVSESYYT